MRFLKIYLDTSIISAYFDLRKPLRQLITEKWIRNDIYSFKPYISELVLNEIDKNPDEKLKLKMFELLDGLEPINLPITEEVSTLAKLYRKQILLKEINDTLHLAVASCFNLDIIVSWNFRHIVNWKTINAVHQINLKEKLGLIEILSLENLGGDKYGNL